MSSAVLAPVATKRALLYLRVSSKGQVNTDYDPEGISLPAQRKACLRKAEQLDLTVVGEYVEPGKSATELSKRVEFQKMLERVRTDPSIDTIIVHKLNRFARNRLDDAIVMASLKKRGVTLISVVENIDDSPVGQLMHGILASFNEYRSLEDGADIAYKMGEKAKNGGTIGWAALGYLNVIERFEGRDVRTVVPDPERKELIQQTFELYASGDYTMEELCEEMAYRGLLTRPTTKAPAKPLSISVMSRLLRKRYYLGVVTHKGVEYRGRHEPIIDTDLFERVQIMLESRSNSGERRRVNRDYLVGMLFCGMCHDAEDDKVHRLIIQKSVGNGGEYLYWFCRGRQLKVCHADYKQYERVERAIIDHYATVRFTPEFIANMRHEMQKALAETERNSNLLAKQIKQQLAKLTTQEENLLDLAADGTIPKEKIQGRLLRIEEQRARLEAEESTVDEKLQVNADLIDACLELLADPQALYRAAGPDTRRLLNQAIFRRIYVYDDEILGHELNEPFAELLALQAGDASYEATGNAERAAEVATTVFQRHAPERARAALTDGPSGYYSVALTAITENRGSSSNRLVELRGIEPRS